MIRISRKFTILRVTMKKIFAYLDYRRFLHDYIEEKKVENQYLLWYLGYHFNIEPNYFRGLIMGKYHLPEENVSRVCAFFRFTRKEIRYFKLLYQYNNAETYSEITRLFRKLTSIRNSLLPVVDRLKYTWSRRMYYPKVHATSPMAWEAMLAGRTNGRRTSDVLY